MTKRVEITDYEKMQGLKIVDVEDCTDGRWAEEIPYIIITLENGMTLYASEPALYEDAPPKTYKEFLGAEYGGKEV